MAAGEAAVVKKALRVRVLPWNWTMCWSDIFRLILEANFVAKFMAEKDLWGGEFWLEDKTWTSLLLLEAEEEIAESSFELRAKNEGCFDLSLGGTGGGLATSGSGVGFIWGFFATGSIQIFS